MAAVAGTSMNQARRLRLPAGGMSLVELLVAMVILAVMTVLGWRGLDSILHTRTTLDAQLEQLRGHQLAFAQMEADCARLARSAMFDGKPTLSATQGRLVLLRSVAEEGGADQLQIVVYRGEDGRLTRSASAATRDLDVLHAVWQSVLSDAAGFSGVTLDDQVAAFELQTWGGSDWQAVGANANANTARLGNAADRAGSTSNVANAAAAGTAVRGPRTRRVVRPPATDATGLRVALHLLDSAGAGVLVRMFILGAG
jgi:general secretion pathway protein J